MTRPAEPPRFLSGPAVERLKREYRDAIQHQLRQYQRALDRRLGGEGARDSERKPE